MSEEKNHPEHKYSVSFESKVGTITLSDVHMNKLGKYRVFTPTARVVVLHSKLNIAPTFIDNNVLFLEQFTDKVSSNHIFINVPTFEEINKISALG